MRVSAASEPAGTGDFRRPPPPTSPEREFSAIVRLRRRRDRSFSRSSGSDTVGTGDIRGFLSPASPEPEISTIFRLRRRRDSGSPRISSSGLAGTGKFRHLLAPTPSDQDLPLIFWLRRHRNKKSPSNILLDAGLPGCTQLCSIAGRTDEVRPQQAVFGGLNRFPVARPRPLGLALPRSRRAP